MIKNYGAGILNIKSFLPHFLILINSSFDYPKYKKINAGQFVLPSPK